MNSIDYILVGVIVAIISVVVFVIYKSKKSGKKCIGCPNSGSCPSAQNGECNCSK